MKLLKLLFILLILPAVCFSQEKQTAEEEPVLPGTVITLTTSDEWEINAVYVAPNIAEENSYPYFESYYENLAIEKEKLAVLEDDEDTIEIDLQTEVSTKKYPIILLVHDYQKDNTSWINFSKKIRRLGFGYLAIDLRGHGKSVKYEEPKEDEDEEISEDKERKVIDYKSFARTGVDNEYNQMVRDVQAGVDYLLEKGYTEQDIIFLGEGLGSNILLKSLVFYKDILMTAVLSPTLKNKGVLTAQSLRLYKNPVLIAVSMEEKKGFIDASILRNIAYISSGEGKVTFLSTYQYFGTEMLDTYFSKTLAQWLKYPILPPVQKVVEIEEPVVLLEQQNLETEQGVLYE